MSFATKSPQDFLFATFVGLSNIYFAWVPYINSNDLSNPALRRAAISIWLNSLIEFLGKKAEREIAIETINHSGTCPKIVIQRIGELEAAAAQILSCFSKIEQICLWYLRNQAVHGHLSLYFHDDTRVLLFDATSGLVEKQSLTRANIESATQALVGFKPIQRLSQSCEGNALLQSGNEWLNSAALDECHMALFARTL